MILRRLRVVYYALFDFCWLPFRCLWEAAVSFHLIFASFWLLFWWFSRFRGVCGSLFGASDPSQVHADAQ